MIVIVKSKNLEHTQAANSDSYLKDFMNRVICCILAAIGTVSGVLLACGVAQAATINVTSTSDSGTGTLGQAIINAAAGGTITFFNGSTTSRTITLSSVLVINKNLTLQRPGVRTFTISGDSFIKPR